MRPISLLTSLVLLSILFSCSGEPNELERLSLKGQIKSIKEVQCDPTYEGDMWVASNRCSGTYRVINLSPQGYYENFLSFGNHNDTLAMTKMKYEEGEIVEELYYQKRSYPPRILEIIPGSRTMMDRVSAEQVNFEVWQSDALVFEGATYYDSKGRIEKQVQVIKNKEVMVHHVYEKDLLVENFQMEEDGTRSATQLYDYVDFDDKGNWTVKLVYVGEEKISPEVAVTRSLEYY
jgi:hypothetical protein